MTKHNVEIINHALRGAVEAEMVHTQSLVTEHFLPMWEVIHNETDGAWPSKSLTRTLISKSQVLTDMFIFLTPEQISEFIRDCKFVRDNFDAVIDEAHANGWRKLSAIRKAIQKAQKAEKEEASGEVINIPLDDWNAEIGSESSLDTESEGPSWAPELENTRFISEIAALLAEAQENGFDPKGIAAAALAEIADPDPLEIPEAFRR